MAWLAALLAACAAWWCVPSGRAGLRRLRPASVGTRRARRRGTLAAASSFAGGLLALAVLAGPRGVALGVAASVLLGTAAHLTLARARRRRASGRRVEVVHAGELMAGLLRVGRVPAVALVEASQDAPVLRLAAAEHAAGGEAAAALRRGAADPGCAGLADLADAWEIATRTGASLVDAMDAAARRLAEEGEVTRVVDAELAAARLAGRTMCLLPLAGLLLAFALGGNPFVFLAGSPVGWLCLDVGVGLACAGVLWIDAVAVTAGGR